MLIRFFVIVILSVITLHSNAMSTEHHTESVLVFGGTGRLGSDIVKALLKHDYNVVVFVRETSNRDRLNGLDVDYVTGDVLDAQTVERAMRDTPISVVIDALGRGNSSVDFYRVAAVNIATSAAKSSVRQIILHGSVGAGDSAAAFGNQRLSASMKTLMRAKSAAETAVEISGVHYTIIRNSRLLRYGTEETGNARLYEDHSLSGVVTRAGLARLTVECVLDESCYDKIYHAVDRSRGGREE